MDVQLARVERYNVDKLPPNTDAALADFSEQSLLQLGTVRPATLLVRRDVLPSVGLGFELSCPAVARFDSKVVSIKT